MSSKDYIHRVGRTARAGRSGQSISLVSQYDVEIFQRIEGVIGKKMEEWRGGKGGGREEMEVMRERVEEAAREAGREVRELEKGGKGKGGKKRFMEWKDEEEDEGEGEDLKEMGVKVKRRKVGKGRRG
jgi:ATP-dependent RNA helicase DDX47/RRP3